MSIFDGVSRPLRAMGLGLLAVAVVAAAVGGVTLVSGGDPEDTAATAPSDPTRGEKKGDGDEKSEKPEAPGDGDTDGGATDDEGADSGDGSGPGDSGDSGDSGEAGDGGGQDKPVSDDTVPVRVYNNSTIKGLASRASEDLNALGWDVVETGNYSAGVIPASTIYFRPGTDEEAVAHSLAETFGMRVEPRFDGIADSSPGLIMIVTQDYAGPDTSK
ncbi:LytR C-terminal domain-containing protein [Saccharomonospora azurea]|uniref:LytR C-terminal domain-containing protein n=1 Tax=Saccharomonospora azurea TaxID=40988 RepID=UPI002409768D|nr:LytR C-terminal domain-containing protein [Saccharomonospora azurea]